ncbi:MAG: OmpH family outer membrane protein [Candidatus Methanofastidiosia archaeon]
MDKNISRNSIKDSFSLIIDTIVEEKSKKIDKKHYAEGFDLLGAEIFPQNKIPFSEDEIKKVGPDFITEWIVKNWSSLNEERRILFFGKLIEQLQRNPKLSRRFNVLLCSKLVRNFPESAIRFLGKICQQTKISPSFPLNKDLCLQIRILFLNPKDILIEQLPLSSVIPGVKDVAKYGIGAAFFESKNGKTAGEKAQIQVLTWIKESGIGLVVPDEIAELIRKSEASAKNISKIKEYLPMFPEEIKWEKAGIDEQTEKLATKELTSATRQDGKPLSDKFTKKEKRSKQTIPPHEREKDTTIRHKVERFDQFDPINSLKQLQKYVQETKSSEKKNQEKILRLKKDHNDLLIDIRDLDRKQEDLKDKFNARQRELANRNAELTELKTNLSTSQQDLSSLRQEKDKLLSQIEEEKAYYNNKLNRFSRTIEAKSNHKQEVIINRIRESLRPEYRNIVKIENMDMTVEAGQVVRSLLKRIFSKLNKEGIDFAEDN